MKNKNLIFISSAIFLIVVFIGATIAYQQGKEEKLKLITKQHNETFIRDYSPRYGNPSAKVYLVEYLDPECESCRQFYPKIKELLAKYKGKVQLVVRYAPFHKNSKIAIRALEAARLQGKYWEAMELLFHYQPIWGSHRDPKPELIFTYLPNLGLDMSKLRVDMNSPKIQSMIKQDTEDLKKLGVRGTPTFFVNGKAQTQFGLANLEQMIKKEIELFY